MAHCALYVCVRLEIDDNFCMIYARQTAYREHWKCELVSPREVDFSPQIIWILHLVSD